MNTRKYIRFVVFLALLVSFDHLAANDDFACGPDLNCDPAMQYCYIMIGGPEGVPPGYQCIDVSDAGASLTCATIPDIGIGCECTESDGQVTVTCTAP